MYNNVINKAIDYVVRNLEANDDTYSLAVASYALQLANHNSKEYILQTLDARSIRKGTQSLISTVCFVFFEENPQFQLFCYLRWPKMVGEASAAG